MDSVNQLSEFEAVELNTDLDIHTDMFSCKTTTNRVSPFSDTLTCISEVSVSIAKVFKEINGVQRKTYYKNPWGYKSKNIPPKVVFCSKRRKGRKCKK